MLPPVEYPDMYLIHATNNFFYFSLWPKLIHRQNTKLKIFFSIDFLKTLQKMFKNSTFHFFDYFWRYVIVVKKCI
jgi:hypothetical protein